MTEQEWLECADPEEMLVRLGELGAGDRKVRLFMVACCRRIWDLFQDERCRQAVETAERYADGFISDEEFKASQEEADTVADEADEMELPHFEKLALKGTTQAAAFALSDRAGRSMTWEANTVAEWAVYARTGSSPVDDPIRESQRLSAFDDEVEAQCDLLRDIFGHPFRPVILDSSWLTPKVLCLAQSIYNDRAFERLPSLADELESGGCASQKILDHCRSPGPHVRGCWSLDLILGKE